MATPDVPPYHPSNLTCGLLDCHRRLIRGWAIFQPSRSLILLSYKRLIRTPTTKEWERFRTYTHRVVELHVGRSFIGEVSPETISFLGIRSTLDQLWPRLTSLRLSNKPGWNSLVSTLGFLSPKVKTLTLILPRNPSILLRPVLSTASVRCNQVQELVLDVVADDPNSAHWVGEFIAASRDTLRTLEIQSPFRGEYLPAIANLPHLWKLRLDKAHFPSDLPPNSFPVLEEFIFPRFQGRRLYHFLRNLRTTSLKVAKIYSTDPVGFTELAAVLSRFSESLMFLEISAVTGLDLFSATVLRSPFTNLRVLHLRCFRYGEAPHSSCTFRPSDQSIADLGASMPYLTNLSLGSPNCIHLQYATFLSLVSLSKTCCDLETLEIKIDFETMITLPHSAPEGAGSNAVPDKTRGSGCRLRKLALGLSIIPDCPGAGWVVAIGLGKIFPSLAEVWGCGPERYRWEEVWTNIKASQQVLRAMGQ